MSAVLFIVGALIVSALVAGAAGFFGGIAFLVFGLAAITAVDEKSVGFVSTLVGMVGLGLFFLMIIAPGL